MGITRQQHMTKSWEDVRSASQTDGTEKNDRSQGKYQLNKNGIKPGGKHYIMM